MWYKTLRAVDTYKDECFCAVPMTHDRARLGCKLVRCRLPGSLPFVVRVRTSAHVPTQRAELALGSTTTG